MRPRLTQAAVLSSRTAGLDCLLLLLFALAAGEKAEPGPAAAERLLAMMATDDKQQRRDTQAGSPRSKQVKRRGQLATGWPPLTFSLLLPPQENSRALLVETHGARIMCVLSSTIIYRSPAHFVAIPVSGELTQTGSPARTARGGRRIQLPTGCQDDDARRIDDDDDMACGCTPAGYASLACCMCPRGASRRDEATKARRCEAIDGWRRGAPGVKSRAGHVVPPIRYKCASGHCSIAVQTETAEAVLGRDEPPQASVSTFLMTQLRRAVPNWEGMCFIIRSPARARIAARQVGGIEVRAKLREWNDYGKKSSPAASHHGQFTGPDDEPSCVRRQAPLGGSSSRPGTGKENNNRLPWSLIHQCSERAWATAITRSKKTPRRSRCVERTREGQRHVPNWLWLSGCSARLLTVVVVATLPCEEEETHFDVTDGDRVPLDAHVSERVMISYSSRSRAPAREIPWKEKGRDGGTGARRTSPATGKHCTSRLLRSGTAHGFGGHVDESIVADLNPAHHGDGVLSAPSGSPSHSIVSKTGRAAAMKVWTLPREHHQVLVIEVINTGKRQEYRTEEQFERHP
nr:unnamed protein product [Digitaria exilis]